MASLSTFRYLVVFFLLNLCLRISQSEGQNLSFGFENFAEDSNFESQLALYGDAKVVSGDSSVQLSGFSAGRIFNKKPFKVVGRKPREKMVSFSMHFVFSLSGEEKGGGFAFVMVPFGYPLDVFDGGSFGLLGGRKRKFLAVEFDTFKDRKFGDVNGNHVGVDLSSFVSMKVSNVSSVKLGLNSGEKLQSWIDYEAGSKRLEVRLSKLGAIKPVNPLLSCSIDLSEVWKDDELLVGLSSSSGNSTQKFNVYSLSFKLWTAPQWMHSEPLDPEAFARKQEEFKKVQSKSDCALRILGALIFGTGCGALGAFLVVIVWTILGSRRPVAVVPEDPAVEHKELDDCKKLKVVVVDKTIKDGKNKN